MVKLKLLINQVDHQLKMDKKEIIIIKSMVMES